MPKLERDYQAGLIDRIKRLLPDCEVIKNNPLEIQGIPDLLILYGPNWAMLEVKRSADADRRPNQEYYVKRFAAMSYAAVIYPEVEEEVLDALQSAFGDSRQTRVS